MLLRCAATGGTVDAPAGVAEALLSRGFAPAGGVPAEGDERPKARPARGGKAEKAGKKTQ